MVRKFVACGNLWAAAEMSRDRVMWVLLSGRLSAMNDEVILEPDDAAPEPVTGASSNRVYREGLDKIRRDTKRSIRTSLTVSVISVFVLGGIVWAVSLTLVMARLDGHMRGTDVKEKLEQVRADTQNANREIGILIEDTKAKIEQAIGKLDEGNDQYRETAQVLINELQTNAAAAKRGFRIQIGKHFWMSGQPPVKLIHSNEGVCFLFFVSGKFDGPDDAVTVDLRPDGHWYLEGKAKNPVRAGAISLKLIPLSNAPPPPPPG